MIWAFLSAQIRCLNLVNPWIDVEHPIQSIDIVDLLLVLFISFDNLDELLDPVGIEMRPLVELIQLVLEIECQSDHLVHVILIKS